MTLKTLELPDSSRHKDARIVNTYIAHHSLTVSRFPFFAMSRVEDFSKQSVEKVATVKVQESSRSSEDDSVLSLRRADDALLAELGYKSEFRREFTVSICQLSECMVTDSVIHCAAVRDRRVCVLYYGCGRISLIHVLLSARVWYAEHLYSIMHATSTSCRRACRNGLWLVDTLPVCLDHCGVNGGTCICYAVSCVPSSPAVSMRRRAGC